MFQIEKCLVAKKQVYMVGDIVEIVTDGGIESNYLSHYTGRILTFDQDCIRLDISEDFNADFVTLPVSSIRDISIHAPSLMLSNI